MQIITSVTQKGQVTLPKKIRDDFGLETYDKVLVEAEKDYIKIKPAADIIALAGSFRPKRKKSILKARQTMEKNYNRV